MDHNVRRVTEQPFYAWGKFQLPLQFAPLICQTMEKQTCN